MSNTPTPSDQIAHLTAENSALIIQNSELKRLLDEYRAANEAIRDQFLNAQSDKMKVRRYVCLLFRSYDVLLALESTTNLREEIRKELGIEEPHKLSIAPPSS